MIQDSKKSKNMVKKNRQILLFLTLLLSLSSSTLSQQTPNNLKISDLSNVFALAKPPNPKISNYTFLITKPSDSVYIFYGQQYIQEFANPYKNGFKRFKLTSNLTQSAYIGTSEDGITYMVNYLNSGEVGKTDEFKKEIKKISLLDKILDYSNPDSSTSYGYFTSEMDLYRLTISDKASSFYTKILEKVKIHSAVSIRTSKEASIAFAIYATEDDKNTVKFGGNAFFMDPNNLKEVKTTLQSSFIDTLNDLGGDIGELKLRYLMDGSDKPKIEVTLVSGDFKKVINTQCHMEYKGEIATPEIIFECGEREQYTPDDSYSSFYCDSSKDYVLCGGNVKDSNTQHIEIFLKKDGKYKGDGASISTINLDNSNIPKIDPKKAFEIENYDDNMILYISPNSRKATFASVFDEIEKDNESFWRMLFVLSIGLIVFLIVGTSFAYSASKKVDFGKELEEMEKDETHVYHVEDFEVDEEEKMNE